jgi:3',5'-cyclic AMP phosphodiesterase CpdA
MKNRNYAFIIGIYLTFAAVITPTQAFNAFQFAVIADPHLSVSSRHSPKNDAKMFKASVTLLQSTVGAINQAAHIDFVVVLGDLTKDAEPWNVNRFEEVMDELKVPWYVVLGNHDISPIDTQKTGKAAGVSRATMIWALQGHGFHGPEPYWSLDPLPGVHLVGLDSTLTGDWGGRVRQSGLDFLAKDLAAHSNKLTIVMLHHQLQAYTEAEKTGENNFNKFVLYNAEAVKTILRQHPQVVMTLSGHAHLSSRYLQADHITYFTLPSIVTWPLRYVVFTVDQQNIKYHTYEVPCSPQIRETAKQNILANWPRTRSTPRTPEGDQALLKLLSSEDTKKGLIKLSWQP